MDLAQLYRADEDASSNTGIEIEVGKFRLNVYDSVAAEYRDGVDQSIRDPAVVLFSLAPTIQANAEVIAKIKHLVKVELYQRDDASEISLIVRVDP